LSNNLYKPFQRKICLWWEIWDINI
jgi:hypothetical protein